MKDKQITVKVLIDMLKDCDPNATVLVSSDEEGNQYSPVLDFCFGSVSDFEYGIYGDYGISGKDKVVVIYPQH